MLQTGTTLTLQNSVQCTVLCPGVGGDGDREDDTVIVVHVCLRSRPRDPDVVRPSVSSNVENE